MGSYWEPPVICKVDLKEAYRKKTIAKKPKVDKANQKKVLEMANWMGHKPNQDQLIDKLHEILEHPLEPLQHQ